MSYNDAIKRLYRSYPEGEFRYKTLEVWHPTMSEPLRVFKTATPVDKSFTLESDAPRNASESVVFSASQFEITEPSVEQENNSEITLDFGINALDYVNEIIDGIEVNAIEFLEPLEIIYRIYHNSDVDAGPSVTPVIMYATEITMEPTTGVAITATSTNNALYRTGAIYTIDTFPGLVTSGA